jgi:hypothetical protein
MQRTPVNVRMIPFAPLSNPKAGYSLILLSILMTVAALIMVAVVPGQQAGDVNYKSESTAQKLRVVENALTGYMALNGSLPCPADGSLAVGTANFGVATTNTGSGCAIGVGMLGPDAGTGNVVAGVIPTNSLHIDDSYALDEWGRRITYVVDQRATTFNSCLALENSPLYLYPHNGIGGIVIKNTTAAGGTVIDNVMHAFISHGPDGHGAFPAQGSPVAGRINAGSIDIDELANAGVNSGFTYSTSNFTNVKVMKDRTSTFGDVLYYAPDQKNTCCVGSCNCQHTGFQTNGITTTDGDVGYFIAVGDVNGDGIPDLVIGAPDANGADGAVYVVFGTKNGFPNPLPLSTLNGTNGIAFIGDPGANTAAGTVVAVGDVNGDGIADIVIGAPFGNTNAGYVYVIFGGTAPMGPINELESVSINKTAARLVA